MFLARSRAFYRSFNADGGTPSYHNDGVSVSARYVHNARFRASLGYTYLRDRSGGDNNADQFSAACECQKLTYHHGEAAVTQHRNYQSVPESSLRANRVQQRVGHRAVIERTNRSPFAVHLQISGCPRDGGADVAGEDSIVVGEFADEPGYVLRMDGAAARFRLRQCIQILAGLAIVVERAIQEAAVRSA